MDRSDPDAVMVPDLAAHALAELAGAFRAQTAVPPAAPDLD